MEERNIEVIKLEIIKGLKSVKNTEILILIKSMIDEINRISKKEAV